METIIVVIIICIIAFFLISLLTTKRTKNKSEEEHDISVEAGSNMMKIKGREELVPVEDVIYIDLTNEMYIVGKEPYKAVNDYFEKEIKNNTTKLNIAGLYTEWGNFLKNLSEDKKYKISKEEILEKYEMAKQANRTPEQTNNASQNTVAKIEQGRIAVLSEECTDLAKDADKIIEIDQILKEVLITEPNIENYEWAIEFKKDLSNKLKSKEILLESIALSNEMVETLQVKGNSQLIEIILNRAKLEAQLISKYNDKSAIKLARIDLEEVITLNNGNLDTESYQEIAELWNSVTQKYPDKENVYFLNVVNQKNVDLCSDNEMLMKAYEKWAKSLSYIAIKTNKEEIFIEALRQLDRLEKVDNIDISKVYTLRAEVTKEVAEANENEELYVTVCDNLKTALANVKSKVNENYIVNIFLLLVDAIVGCRKLNINTKANKYLLGVGVGLSELKSYDPKGYWALALGKLYTALKNGTIERDKTQIQNTIYDADDRGYSNTEYLLAALHSNIEGEEELALQYLNTYLEGMADSVSKENALLISQDDLFENLKNNADFKSLLEKHIS